ncbi:MAG: hypothetical protein ABR921_09245 [Candidatus Sulfotelmatobacter sp.]|jgi:hypothetical protein
MNSLLPPAIAKGASLRGNEYGWPISAFPEALAKARSLGFACIGGQFQFRLPDSICEMYWLSADPAGRRDDEPWSDFSNRSCSEVMSKFEDLVSKTDFVREAANWKLDARDAETLVFVAYFESESTFAEISATRHR